MLLPHSNSSCIISSLFFNHVSVITEHVKSQFLKRSIRDSNLLVKLLAFKVELLKVKFFRCCFTSLFFRRSAGTKLPQFSHSFTFVGGCQSIPDVEEDDEHEDADEDEEVEAEGAVDLDVLGAGTNEPVAWATAVGADVEGVDGACLLYTSPSPRDS